MSKYENIEHFREIKEWEEKGRYVADKILAKADSMLSDKKYDEYSTYISNEYLTKKYMLSEKMAYAYFVAYTYQKEKEVNIEHKDCSDNRDKNIASRGLIEMCQKVDDFCELIKKIKFMLWRMEFCVDDDIYCKFMENIRDTRISKISVAEFINCMCFNKERAFYAAGLCYRQLGFVSEALYLYIQGNMAAGSREEEKYRPMRHLPKYSEDCLCEIADIMWENGQKQKAMEYMKIIEMPTSITNSYLERWAKS